MRLKIYDCFCTSTILMMTAALAWGCERSDEEKLIREWVFKDVKVGNANSPYRGIAEGINRQMNQNSKLNFRTDGHYQRQGGAIQMEGRYLLKGRELILTQGNDSTSYMLNTVNDTLLELQADSVTLYFKPLKIK